MRAWHVAALTVLVLAAGSPFAHAGTPAKSKIKVTQAWIRVLPANLPAGGYAVIHNQGNTDRHVTGASSPAYTHVMLHRSTNAHGMSQMHAVKQLAVPAHGRVKLAPGGYHLMLMQARQAVKPGDRVPVTLTFADGDSVTVEFIARPASASGPG
jgi:copper(I)-binding protein